MTSRLLLKTALHAAVLCFKHYIAKEFLQFFNVIFDRIASPVNENVCESAPLRRALGL